MKITALLGVLGLFVVQAPPQFEVASVKANNSGDAKFVIQPQPGGRFTATNASLRELVRYAYRLQDFQIAGGPSWLDRDRFDIVARAGDGGQGDPFQADARGGASRGQLMLRALLAERFSLATHLDTKELPIYGLVLARSDGALGPQLTRAARDCDPPGARSACEIKALPGTIAAGGAALTELANALSPLVARVVENHTGLDGKFAFTLRWTPEQMSPGLERKARAMGLPPANPDGSSLFTAVREQLGLKLDSRKGPVETLVIDRAERPKED
jgi:uncharacterized protein (TIGR03435 family)